MPAATSPAIAPTASVGPTTAHQINGRSFSPIARCAEVANRAPAPGKASKSQGWRFGLWAPACGIRKKREEEMSATVKGCRDDFIDTMAGVRQLADIQGQLSG
jgi:hypothetical protein